MTTMTSTFSRASALPTKECSHCGTTTTPLWRKVNNRVVCNACGLYFKKHDEFPRSRSRSTGSSPSFSRVPSLKHEQPRHPELTQLIMAVHEPTPVPDERSPVVRVMVPKRASVQRHQHQVYVRKVSAMLPPVRQYITLPSPASQPPPTGLTPAPAPARDFEPLAPFDISTFLALGDDADTTVSVNPPAHEAVTITPTNVFPETEIAWPWLAQEPVAAAPTTTLAEPAYAVPASPTFSVSTTGESSMDVTDPVNKPSFCLDDILADVRVGSPSLTTYSVPDCDPVDQFLSLGAF